MTAVHPTAPSAPAADPDRRIPLDDRLRWTLLADGALATVLCAGGLLTGRMQAEWTGLPPELHFVAAVGLLPYAVRALRTGRRRTATAGGLTALLVYNVTYAVAAAGLLAGGWVRPTAVGTALVASYVVIPTAVAAVIASTLRRGDTGR